jgi:protein Tob/BTG
MHIEIQVALNFVISYLYNKLPRRRVNLFGEELERALRDKFNGHWYPDKPVRGSAYRCIKTGTGPVDPVLERAARESGIPVQDILENMPQELAVWVDPGEVSYRIGEKGAVRILYSESNGNCAGTVGNNNSTTPTQISSEDDLDTEVRKTFNPDAQCFRPIQNALGNLNLGPSTKSNGCISPYQSNSVLSTGSPPPTSATLNGTQPTTTSQKTIPTSAPVQAPVQNGTTTGSVSPIPQVAASSTTAAPFLGRPTAPPLTFTTATFAQTKFGSTKLKTSSKRANRMSPTEFSNYIKQRALQQQQQQQQAQQNGNGFVGSRPRSLSPHPPTQPNQNGGLPPQAGNPENYFFPGRHYLHFPAPQYHHQPHPLQSDMHFTAQQQQHHKFPTYLDSQSHYYQSPVNMAANSGGSNGTQTTILPPAMSPTSGSSAAVTSTSSQGNAGSPGNTANTSSSQESGGKQQLLDGLNFGLQTYQSGQYQHLLVAN